MQETLRILSRLQCNVDDVYITEQFLHWSQFSIFCSFNFLLTTNWIKIKINIIQKSSLNISCAKWHKLQTELNLNCSSNTKKSKEIIPLNIFKRKWIAFHIQWGRYKFDTRKCRCNPRNVYRWEHTRPHLTKFDHEMTEWTFFLISSPTRWRYTSI